MEPARRVPLWIRALVLLGVLSLAGFAIGGYLHRHRVRSVNTLLFLVQVKSACDQYKVATQALPSMDPDGGTRELRRVLGPLLPKPSETKAEQCVDEWGGPLRYRVDGRGQVELRSAGPDGIFDTADDVAFSG